VNDRTLHAPLRAYETTLDRAGLALAAGSLLGGCVVVALVMLAGQRDPLALVAAWLLGTVFSLLGITAVAGPLWLALHLAGLRRARHAALVGAIAALAIFVGGQTYGFGLFAMPPTDSRTLLFRWVSALATSGVLAFVAAAIGVAMWKVAYRRVL
jgi:hypothetical protein